MFVLGPLGAILLVKLNGIFCSKCHPNAMHWDIYTSCQRVHEVDLHQKYELFFHVHRMRSLFLLIGIWQMVNTFDKIDLQLFWWMLCAGVSFWLVHNAKSAPKANPTHWSILLIYYYNSRDSWLQHTRRPETKRLRTPEKKWLKDFFVPYSQMFGLGVVALQKSPHWVASCLWAISTTSSSSTIVTNELKKDCDNNFQLRRVLFNFDETCLVFKSSLLLKIDSHNTL